MRLQASLVFPLLVGAAQATSETAKVYIFQQPKFPTSSITPKLTPEEARLVIAQRLGVSRYHGLLGVSNDALAHINAFGGPQTQLFTDDSQDRRSQVVVVIDNASPEVAARYQKQWAPIQPAFEISTPPSRTANLQLIGDLKKQNPLIDVTYDCPGERKINPFDGGCWEGRAKLLHFEALSSTAANIATLEFVAEMLRYVKKGQAMDVMVILMPESSLSSSHQYGFYDMPARLHNARSAQFEEPIEGSETSSFHESNIFSQTKGKKNTTIRYSTCYYSNDTCQNATNGCSGHGQCYMKYKSDKAGGSCYTCDCVASIKITKAADGTELSKRTYWGGAACQKQDVSSPFWLLVGISVVLVGLVSAGIGMLFSIGEEKLPSVIGAGVSGPKAR